MPALWIPVFEVVSQSHKALKTNRLPRKACPEPAEGLAMTERDCVRLSLFHGNDVRGCLTPPLTPPQADGVLKTHIKVAYRGDLIVFLPDDNAFCFPNKAGLDGGCEG